MYGLFCYTTSKIFGIDEQSKGTRHIIETNEPEIVQNQHQNNICKFSCTGLLNISFHYESLCRFQDLDESVDYEKGFNMHYLLESESTGVQLDFENFRNKLILLIENINDIVQKRFILYINDIKDVFDSGNSSNDFASLKPKQGNVKKEVIALKINLNSFRSFWNENTFMQNNLLYTNYINQSNVIAKSSIQKKNHK